VQGHRIVQVLAGALASMVIAAPAAQAGGPDPTGAAALTVTRQEQLSPRLVEFGLRTAALPAETNLRVLLPDGYDAQPDRRWPVLYLLHGCCDFDVPGSRAWTTHGEAAEATAGLPLIVVMPDAGRGGFYSDWLLPGAQGQPQWETYHLGQLMPWIDAHYRTLAKREGRVIAGLSMGGYGTMKYASLHPDWFVAAASFSGAVNTRTGALEGSLDALSAQDGGYPGVVWGPYASEKIRWRGDNPWDLAENLRPLQLGLRTGNGQPGELDEGGLPYDPVEGGVYEQTVSLHEKLVALGIPHTYDYYGNGTHSWPYWARSLRRSLVDLMGVLANPPAPPARVTYTAVDPRYEVFDWRVAIERPALEFSRLSNADRDGFVLEGSGKATVTTPAIYEPGSGAAVRAGSGSRQVTADKDGRLTIPVDLGPGNAVQQDLGAPTVVRKATIAIDGKLAPKPCVNRGVVTITLPRGLRRARVMLGARRLPVRGRRVRVDLRGRSAGVARVVIRGTTRGGRAYRATRVLAVCVGG
jgi:S-formylglutathione hydrolase FrmB